MLSLLGIELIWIDTSRSLAVFISLICSLVATLISAHNIYGHLSHYGSPNLQRYIVRILVIVPVYAIASWFSLQFENQAILFETIRDCYEAFVVYSFLSLVLAFCGGESSCVARMQTESPMKHPFPLCFLSPIVRNGRFLRFCKKGTIQFVVVKPCFAVLSLTMLLFGQYHSEGYQWILYIVYNISYTLALYCLLLFYMATSHILKPFHPVSKFFAVKSVIFMTFWQSLLVNEIPGITVGQALAWQDFIICIEMVFFSLLHYFAFSSREFRSAFEVMPDSVVLKNMKEVLSVNDVVADAYHNFMPSYQDYVLERTDDEVPERFRARTYLVGNLDSPVPCASNRAKDDSDSTKSNDSTPSDIMEEENVDDDGHNRPVSPTKLDIDDLEPSTPGRIETNVKLSPISSSRFRFKIKFPGISLQSLAGNGSKSNSQSTNDRNSKPTSKSMDLMDATNPTMVSIKRANSTMDIMERSSSPTIVAMKRANSSMDSIDRSNSSMDSMNSTNNKIRSESVSGIEGIQDSRSELNSRSGSILTLPPLLVTSHLSDSLPQVVRSV